MSIELAEFSNVGAALFKTRYVDTGQLDKILKARSPLYALIQREGDQFGEVIHVPIKYSGQKGHAKGVEGLALLNDATHSPIAVPKFERFLLNLEFEYGRADFHLPTIKKMGSDKGAFLRLYDTQVKEAIGNFADSVAHALYGDGTGVIATVASASISAGSGTITLSNKLDALFIEKDDVINMINPASPANVVGGPTVTTSYFRVTKRNAQAGILDVTRVGTNAVDSVAAGWQIAKLNAYKQYGANRIKGLGAICPLTAPTAGDSFYSTDRSVDVNTMAGWRWDGSAATPLEYQVRDTTMYMYNASVDGEIRVFANPVDVRAMLERAGAKVEYSEEMLQPDGEYRYGVRYTTIATDKGDVKVHPDPYCPRGRWFGLNMSAIALGHLGEEPELIKAPDGSAQLRVAGQDGFTMEWRFMGQVLPKMPVNIVTGALS